MIPYGRQIIDEDDIAAVTSVLNSPFITQGPAIPQFEKAVTSVCGAKHGVAVNSATSALHIACLALGLGPGDVMWTSPISFVASANCARYCGADVDFVDIDPITYNMSPQALEEKLTVAEKTGNLPKIIIPVHLTGQSCEMEKIHSLASHYGIKIIEDASHAIGAHYQGKPVGDCRYSDITVFSFHPVKIVTTAEGGLATTNDDGLASAMQLLRSHGITRDEALLEQKDAPSWYYEQQILGFNYRITDMQAALGASQMEKLTGFIDSRRELARFYTQALKDLNLTLPTESEASRSSFHLYVIGLANKDSTGKTDKNRNEVFQTLRDKGLGVNLHYWPIHLQPYYRALGFGEGDFPNAESYAKKSISIPMFAQMSTEERNRVVEILKDTV